MRLHLGCGNRVLPGFVNVDLADLPHVDYVRDVRDLSCFGDCTAQLIYASHVLEYFDRQEAVSVLAEWRRVLQPGGTLRLAVPDFAQLMTIYADTGNLSTVLGPLFGRIEIPLQGDVRVAYHRTTYDAASLEALLHKSGFDGVRRWNWREVDHGLIDDHSQAYFPHMDKESGIQVSLNLEAQRSPNAVHPAQ